MEEFIAILIMLGFLFGVGNYVSKMIFFITLIIVLIEIAYKTSIKGFENLSVSREIDRSKIFVGETFDLNVTIENNKKLPITYLTVDETFPKEFEVVNGSFNKGFNHIFHRIKCCIYGYERRKRKFDIRVKKRGTYIFNEIKITIGDIFGFLLNDKTIKDTKEVVVYPKVKELCKFKFRAINTLGDNIVKRWIYKDPVFIKGIREYMLEDRMKDIHWKSSLKMNKLMVKEYDNTSDREIVLIVNVQCGASYVNEIYEEPIDRAVNFNVSLAQKCIREGIPVGMWTNANIISSISSFPNEVKPSSTNINNILELSARMDYLAMKPLSSYLLERKRYFKPNTLYILITPYLDDNCIDILKKLNRKGIQFKIIDVSNKNNLPSINGIEKLELIEEVE